MEFKHTPVLLEETIEGLNIRPDGLYLDGTLGGGGHSEEILKKLTGGHLIALDQDEEAIAYSRNRLKSYGEKISIYHTNYVNFEEALSEENVTSLDGILLDLGISSHQVDDSERGFSYRFDGPLDMRMDQSASFTAADIVNTYSEEELYRVIHDYGEDPFAHRIASFIVRSREEKPIKTTFELVEILKEAIPKKIQAKKGHPAKQTFQALRIEVNGELRVLEDSLSKMLSHLNSGGRFAIITFHSLEDRMVKEFFRKAENPCTCPKDFPVCVCGKKSEGRVITRKAIAPSEEEIVRNPRSQSAHLRIFEKA